MGKQELKFTKVESLLLGNTRGECDRQIAAQEKIWDDAVAAVFEGRKMVVPEEGQFKRSRDRRFDSFEWDDGKDDELPTDTIPVDRIPDAPIPETPPAQV